MSEPLDKTYIIRLAGHTNKQNEDFLDEVFENLSKKLKHEDACYLRIEKLITTKASIEILADRD